MHAAVDSARFTEDGRIVLLPRTPPSIGARLLLFERHSELLHLIVDATDRVREVVALEVSVNLLRLRRGTVLRHPCSSQRNDRVAEYASNLHGEVWFDHEDLVCSAATGAF